MTAVDDFGMGHEERMLRRAARRLLREAWSTDRLHRSVAGGLPSSSRPHPPWDEALWRRMVELGWTATVVPERAGGAGLGAVAAVGILEEIGRAALPSPLSATFASAALLARCHSTNADRFLEAIAAGKPFSVASTDQGGSFETNDTSVHARFTRSGQASMSPVDDAALLVDGAAFFVQDARKVESFVVKARTPDGLALFVVDVGTPGLRIVPESIADLTRDQAQVVFEHVVVPADRIVAFGPAAFSAMAGAESTILVGVAADIVGAAEWQLETTVEYAKTRVQFDRAIGAFQAVKHPLVDVMTMIDEARALLYRAAKLIDVDHPEAEVLARMAKSRASDVASRASGCSIQLHGGIGFTWEHAAHIYFKRQKHSELLWGDGPYHRAKLADRLIGAVGEDDPNDEIDDDDEAGALRAMGLVQDAADGGDEKGEWR